MYKITLDCEVITPLFMYGADGRTPEIRPSEIKGMMRLWWRAIRAENNIQNLKKEEYEIFGGTGDKANKSKVIVSIECPDIGNHLGNNLKSDYDLNWGYNMSQRKLEGNHAGIGYLLYSTVLPDREKKYIKDGFKFKIVLRSHVKEYFLKACASLWLAIYLGGFGTRSRRGGGNIVVKSISESTVSDNEILDFVPKGNNLEEFGSWISKNLNKAKEDIVSSQQGKAKGDIGSSQQGTRRYTILNENEILIFDNGYTSWIDALNFLGKEYMNFRAGVRGRIFDTPSFGMPVMHQGSTVRMVPYTNVRISDRMASPIIFKVIAVDSDNGKKYFPVIVCMSPPDNIYVGKEGNQNGGWQPDYRDKPNPRRLKQDILDEFIDKYMKKCDKPYEEVIVR